MSIDFIYTQMSKQFYFKQFSLPLVQFQCQKQFHFKLFRLSKVRSLNVKRVLFHAIQFCTSTQFSSIWPIDRTLYDVTTPGLCGRGSDGNEWVLRIPQSSSIIGTSLSDCLRSYCGARDVMVIVVGNGHGDTSSNSGRDWFHFT